MSDLKIQHILTLSHLLSKGARYNFIQITTSSLAKNIKKSQQSASKHLLELETNGFIERVIHGRKVSVKITQDGYAELLKLHLLLRANIETSVPSLELKGTVISGMGEGAYYMALKGYTKQFKSKIGFVPFPGTLNVKLNQPEYIQAVEQFVALKV